MMVTTNPAMVTTHVPRQHEEEDDDEEELQHPPPSSSCTSPLAVTDDYGTFSPPPPPLPSPLSICDDAHLTTPQPPTDGSDATSAAVGPSPPVIFKEKWRQKEARIRRKSPIGHLPGWRLLPVIIKSNDDLRQEQFASQLLRQVDKIVRAAHLPVWLRPYDIIATSIDGGMLEAIPDTVSLDALRRNDTRCVLTSSFLPAPWLTLLSPHPSIHACRVQVHDPAGLLRAAVWAPGLEPAEQGPAVLRRVHGRLLHHLLPAAGEQDHYHPHGSPGS